MAEEGGATDDEGDSEYAVKEEEEGMVPMMEEEVALYIREFGTSSKGIAVEKFILNLFGKYLTMEKLFIVVVTVFVGREGNDGDGREKVPVAVIEFVGTLLA